MTTKNTKKSSAKKATSSKGKAKAKPAAKGKAKGVAKKTPSIRALFRELSLRKGGVTIAELRKEAAKVGVKLAGVKVAETDTRLTTHCYWYAMNELGWEFTCDEDKGRFWGTPPKGESQAA